MQLVALMDQNVSNRHPTGLPMCPSFQSRCARLPGLCHTATRTRSELPCPVPLSFLRLACSRSLPPPCPALRRRRLFSSAPLPHLTASGRQAGVRLPWPLLGRPCLAVTGLAWLRRTGAWEAWRVYTPILAAIPGYGFC